jgi:adiponectin receptor
LGGAGAEDVSSPLSAKPSPARLCLNSIVDVCDAPEWTHVTRLTRGYRIFHSKEDALLSLFTLHNDTLNIWTHLLGLAWLLYVTPETYSQLRRNGSYAHDYVFFTLYLIGAVTQMATSVLYHTFRCVSSDVETALLKLDILGIFSMLCGAWILAMTQVWHCKPLIAAAYLAAEAVILCSFAYSGVRAAHDPRWVSAYHFVAALSVGFGLVPCLHALFNCATRACFRVLSLAEVGVFASYAAGFVFFITRVPERFLPGVFDIFGHSHAVWHLFVWIACRHWLLGMLEFNSNFMQEGAAACA